GSKFIRVTTHDSPGNNVVYAAITPTDVAVPGNTVQVLTSSNQGETWTAMDPFPDKQANGFAADPTNPNVVFSVEIQAAGNDFFRGDSSQPAGSQWTLVSGAGAGGTAPHPDNRELIFDADNNLLDANDGGIYRLVNPDDDSSLPDRKWFSVNGNMRPTE